MQEALNAAQELEVQQLVEAFAQAAADDFRQLARTPGQSHHLPMPSEELLVLGLSKQVFRRRILLDFFAFREE